jgi:hypothetical protein
MNASRDDNRVPTMIAALQTDGKTVVPIAVNPITNALKVSDGLAGVSHSTEPAIRDENRDTGIMGVSSADGVTLIPIYADAFGNLLIQSN